MAEQPGPIYVGETTLVFTQQLVELFYG